MKEACSCTSGHDAPAIDRADDAALFKALGDERRLKMIDVIAANPGICACSLLERFDMSQSTLSHHMKLLTEARLVSCERQGKWMHYSVAAEGFGRIRAYASEVAQA